MLPTLFSNLLMFVALAQVSPTDREAIKAYSNRLRGAGVGVVLTPPVGKVPPTAEKSRNFLQSLIEELAGSHFAAKGIHVKVNVYSSFAKNAFATKPETIEGSSWSAHRYLGVADDGKPVYEVGVLQGIFDSFKSKDELAFLLGHELGHILSEHLKRPGNRVESAEKWYSSQANEVQADFFGLELMRGKYDLEASVEFMGRLLKINPDAISPYEALRSSHHHPSVRLAAMLSKIQEFRRSDASAAPRARQPLLPSDLPFTKVSPRTTDDKLPADFQKRREEFFRWFDDFMAPRSTLKYVWDKMWKDYPVMEQSRLTKQEARLLLHEALARITGLSSLSKTEKIERALEVLTVFNENLSSLNWPSDAGTLGEHLKRIAFSTAESWDPKGVIDLFSKRTQVHKFPASVQHRETLLSLTQKPELLPIFNRFAAASPKWSQVIDELYGLHADIAPVELRDLLQNATKTEWPESQAKALVQKLREYSLEKVYEQPFGILLVRRLLEIQSSAEGPNCKNLACKEIAQFLNKQHGEYNQRLRTRFKEVLSLDPTTLEPDVLGQYVVELGASIQRNHYMSEKFAFEIKNAELSGLGSRLWAWSEVAQKYRQESSLTTRLMMGELQRKAAAVVVSELSASPHIGAEAMAQYKKVRPHLSSTEDDAFAKRLTPQQLRALVVERPLSPLENAEILNDISAFTGRTPAEVRAIGLKWQLFDKLRDRLSRADPQKLSEQELQHGKMIKDRIKAHLDEISNLPFELLEDPFVAKAVSPILTEVDLESIAKAARRLYETSKLADVFEGPEFEEPGSNSSFKIASRAKKLEMHMIDMLIDQQARGIKIERWAAILRDIIEPKDIELTSIPLEKKTRLASYLSDRMRTLSPTEQMRLLESKALFSVLGEEHAGERLATNFVATISRTASIGEKARAFLDVQKRFDLQKNHPEANRIFESKVAEILKLQPAETKLFFPEQSKAFDWANFSGHIRGGSAIVAQVQQLSVAEQMDFIDYVTGRREGIPDCIGKMAQTVAKYDSTLPFEDFVLGLKAKLSGESSIVRSLALLPFFTGSTSMLRSQDGLDAVLGKIFKKISPANQQLARELAHGILRGEGNNAPFAFAMIFGQRSSAANGELGEAEILCSLFQAYGVPGTKLGQYLGFISEFKALASLQDQAMPLSYLEAVRLLELRFPGGLPNGYRVLGVKGSGSVNIGIEYFNPVSNKNEILTVTREAIETATSEDFRRLRNVILELTNTPDGAKRYGFMLGLDEVIQKSVELEFNREQVFKNHAELAKVINREKFGWNVRMVEPYAIENGVIRMEMAQGTPARLVEERNPELYKSAMQAASSVMVDHLLQEDDAAKRGFRYFADSDFHNGQVFIDAKTKTVYLFDPGQAIEINREEYEQAKAILKVLSGAIDYKNGSRLIQESRLFNPMRKTSVITEADLALVLRGREPADAFIKLIAHLKQKGGAVPLPVVQWVLGMNRQIALNKKLGLPLERRLFTAFVMDSAADLARRKRGCIGNMISLVMSAVRARH